MLALAVIIFSYHYYTSLSDLSFKSVNLVLSSTSSPAAFLSNQGCVLVLTSTAVLSPPLFSAAVDNILSFVLGLCLAAVSSFFRAFCVQNASNSSYLFLCKVFRIPVDITVPKFSNPLNGFVLSFTMVVQARQQTLPRFRLRGQCKVWSGGRTKVHKSKKQGFNKSQSCLRKLLEQCQRKHKNGAGGGGE